MRADFVGSDDVWRVDIAAGAELDLKCAMEGCRSPDPGIVVGKGRDGKSIYFVGEEAEEDARLLCDVFAGSLVEGVTDNTDPPPPYVE
jgi:hypothetical protein